MDDSCLLKQQQLPFTKRLTEVKREGGLLLTFVVQQPLITDSEERKSIK